MMSKENMMRIKKEKTMKDKHMNMNMALTVITNILQKQPKLQQKCQLKQNKNLDQTSVLFESIHSIYTLAYLIILPYNSLKQMLRSWVKSVIRSSPNILMVVCLNLMISQSVQLFQKYLLYDQSFLFSFLGDFLLLLEPFLGQASFNCERPYHKAPMTTAANMTRQISLALSGISRIEMPKNFISYFSQDPVYYYFFAFFYYSLICISQSNLLVNLATDYSSLLSSKLSLKEEQSRSQSRQKYWVGSKLLFYTQNYISLYAYLLNLRLSDRFLTLQNCSAIQFIDKFVLVCWGKGLHNTFDDFLLGIGVIPRQDKAGGPSHLQIGCVFLALVVHCDCQEQQGNECQFVH